MKINPRVIIKKFKDKFYTSVYLLLATMLLCSHNLYIKMETYFLQPDQQTTLSLYNGTFEISENIITRDRILDASIIAQGERVPIKPDQWKDQDSTITQLTFNTGKAGTYIAGVSTKARNIELTADKFNSYLEHDGIIDMLKQRTDNSSLDQDAVESYQKHVKAIYQVGDIKTDDWKAVLGYPIEFVPQANPYEKYSGDTLAIKLLLDGKPLPNQLVYADYLKSTEAHTHNGQTHKHDETTHSHDSTHKTHTHKHDETTHSHDSTHKTHTHKHDETTHSHNSTHKTHTHKHDETTHSHNSTHKTHTHKHDETTHSHNSTTDDNEHKSQSEKEHTHSNGQQLRTNDQGIVLVNLPEDGIYYLRTIHMVNVTDSDELTHQSKWATLTFEVTHKHETSTHSHDDHASEGDIPTWIFILGSLLIIGLLFLVFRKKNS